MAHDLAQKPRNPFIYKAFRYCENGFGKPQVFFEHSESPPDRPPEIAHLCRKTCINGLFSMYLCINYRQFFLRLHDLGHILGH